MPTVKSLEDLQRIREEALKKREIKEQSGQTEIIVGMGTPGIAAGARDTMRAILQFIEVNRVPDITVRQTGNIGLDSWEPIVIVTMQNLPKVTYGKVTPAAAERIMREHVLEGQIVKDYVIES
jgi:NADP-reducing hydrogenase subunit HndB